MPRSLETLGKNVRERLDSSGMSQDDMATKMGTSQSTLNRYLTGKVEPGTDVIDRMASALGCQTWELLKPPGEPRPAPEPTRSSIIGEIVLILASRNKTQLDFILRLLKRRFVVEDLENLARKRG